MVMVVVAEAEHGQILVSEMIQILDQEAQDILVMETMALWAVESAETVGLKLPHL
jgi:hypothetical protein